MREAVARIVRHIMADSGIEVMPSYFDGALTIFESRLDKGYSMTDCISMSIMYDYEVTEVLTHDRHFAQEGFVILL
jgi:predicted nucleic acid-binding protein